MKILSLIFILISTTIFSQDIEKRNFLDLQTEFNLVEPATGTNYSKFEESTAELIISNTVILQEKKSTGLAILYSLLLPGMGELYAGNYSFGKYLAIADGVLWGTLAGFTIYGNWQKSNYQSYAEVYGSISLDNKDDDFYANVANYTNIYDYNREQELNREFDKLYNTETHYWSWEDETERIKYRKMWLSSEDAFNNIRFVAGALVINRVVSIINAVRCVSNYNKSLEQEMSWNIYVGLEQPNIPTDISLNFITLL